MDKVNLDGLMVDSIRGNTKMIKDMDMVYTHGLMEEGMKGIG